LWMNLGDTYFWKPETRTKAAEDYRKAIELCEQTLSVNPKDSAALRVLGMSQAMLNAKIAALTSIAKAIQAAPADPVNLYYAALIHAQFGEIKTTLDWVKKAIEAGATVAYIRDSPNLQFLADNARFQALLNTKKKDTTRKSTSR